MATINILVMVLAIIELIFATILLIYTVRGLNATDQILRLAKTIISHLRPPTIDIR